MLLLGRTILPTSTASRVGHTASAPPSLCRFNEPWVTCNLQWGNGDFAPGVNEGQKGKWVCGHYLLLSHAAAVKVYRDKFQKGQGGKIGMALWSEWSEPFRNTPQGARKGRVGTGSRAQRMHGVDRCVAAAFASNPMHAQMIQNDPAPHPLLVPFLLADKRAAQNKMDVDFGWCAPCGGPAAARWGRLQVSAAQQQP